MRGAVKACDACLRRGELVGRVAPRIADLLRRPGARPAGLLELSDENLIAATGGERADDLRRWLAGFSAGRAWERVHAAGLDCVCRHSPVYPRALDALNDPPAVLYLAGGRARFEALVREPVVTIVGSREATPYALEVARSLGRALAAARVTVVSGLALGVDGAAHRGTLAAGDAAVAVLASGADVPSPASHRHLYGRVREQGVVVSEVPPGTPPMRWSFPARNRIMAALGRMTVVVEAKERSGSLITAAFAEEMGRDVGAVPGRVTSSRAAGSNRLLRDGARLVRGAEDVLDEIFGVGGGRDRAGRASGGAGGGQPARYGSEADETGFGAARLMELEPPVRRVLEAVEAGHPADAIGREAALSPGEVRAALGRLELLGLVTRDGLGLYERALTG